MAQSQYATVADLTTFSIPQTAANFFGNTAMVAALQAASSIADSYLASQFTLPLQTNPPASSNGWDKSLTIAVCNIATYLLYNQFGFSADQPGDELAKKRYADALLWLSQIRDKKLFPQFIDSNATDPVSQEGGPFIVSDAPVGFVTNPPNSTGTCGDW